VKEETTKLTIVSRGKGVLRRFIPDSLLKERSIIQNLGPKAGRVYTRLRILDAFGVHTSSRRRVSPSARSFVFVCYGNIMRSALAEFLMRQALHDAGLTGQVQIVSAGLHASPGREAHPWAQQAAAELGISLAEHRAKSFSLSMAEQADCVFAMDFQNKAELLTLYRSVQEKILMLSAYAEGPWQYRQILDPYHGDVQATLLCGQQLRTCVRNLIAFLFPRPRPTGKRTAALDSQPGRPDSVGKQEKAVPAMGGNRTRN
jgi:protein-tyrosine phosphatase